MRGLYVEIGGRQVRVNGASNFDGIYVVVWSDERMMLLHDPKNSLYEGNINRINGDLWIVQWGDENKSSSQTSVSGQCRPYKPLF